MPKWMLVSVTTIRRECGERHYATPASVKNNFPSSQLLNGNLGTNRLRDNHTARTQLDTE